jgi:hypothetical protein
MRIRKDATIAAIYGLAVDLAMQKDKTEAHEWFEAIVARIIEDTLYSESEATDIAQRNIGYWAGYYGEEERRAVADVYGAMHPIFGNDFNPSAAKAFEAGKRVAYGEFDAGHEDASGDEGQRQGIQDSHT